MPGDAAALAELGARTFVDAFAAANRAEDISAYLERTYGASMQRREIEDANVVTLLVEDDGRTIGFAQLRRSVVPQCVHDANAIELARFYVDQRWHGRGVAQQLMDAANDAARSRNATSVWLGVWERNARAIAFYEKAGFDDVGSQPFVLGSDLQTDRVMLRPLQ